MTPMAGGARCPVCKVAVRPTDKFCSLCQCAIPRPPGEAEPEAPSPAPSDFDFDSVAPATDSPKRTYEPIELPSSDTPESEDEDVEDDVGLGFFETPDPTHDELRTALSELGRFTALGPGLPPEEVRRKLAWFARKQGPSEALVSWFSTANGASRAFPGHSPKLLSLDEAIECRKRLAQNALSLDGWETYRRRTDYLPLWETPGGDLYIYDTQKGRRGVDFLDHECPDAAPDTTSLLHLVEHAVELWKGQPKPGVLSWMQGLFKPPTPS